MRARGRRAPRRAAARRGGSRPTRRRRRARLRPCRRGCRTGSRRRTRHPSDAAPSRASASSTGSGSGLWRSVSSAPMSTSVSSRSTGKRSNASCTVATPLRGHDARAGGRGDEARQQLEHAVEGLERRVERLVVGAVHVDELVDAVRVEIAHLGDEARAADRGAHELLVGLAAEHRHGRVPHRGEDDRPRVDQGAVEIEEDDAATHEAIVSAARHERSGPCHRRSRPARGTGPRRAPSRRLRSGAGLRATPRTAPGSPRASSPRASAPCGAGTIGGDGEMQRLPVPLPARPRRSCAETRCRFSAGRERREVVLAVEAGGAGRERVLVDRARPPQAAVGLERRPGWTIEHDVAVRARASGESRVEPRV